MHTNLAAVSLFILAAIYPLRWDDDTTPMSDECREEVLHDTVATLLFTGEQSASNLHLYTSRGYALTGQAKAPGGVVLVHLAKELS